MWAGVRVAHRGRAQSDRPAAERALHGLVADLKVVNDEHGLIDTIYREQAWDTICDLAKRLRIPETWVTSWFDEGRRF